MDTLYDRGRDALAGAGAGASFAETHGVLCALLCVPGGADTGGWLEDLLADPDASAEAIAACRTLLAECLARSAGELSGGEFAFAPLLPADEALLAERTEALGEWCGGFLFGLGTAGVGDPSTLGRDAAEAVQDLARLARLASAGDEPGGSEADYAELVEFVRVAVMSVYEDLAAGRAG